MDIEHIIEIGKNPEEKSNQELIESRDLLYLEFEKTKSLVLNLTRHMDTVSAYYESINKEIGKRLK